MAARMGAYARIARTACRICLCMTAMLIAELLATAAGAQEPPATVHRPGSRTATQWDLPRIFYDERQRRSLDAQDRAVRLGLNVQANDPSGPRFDGWLSGPAGTHAWVSGTRYVADRAGHLRAAGDPAAEAIESGAAQLDRARGVLVIRRETEGSLQLRVGESDLVDPAAAPQAGATVRP